MCGVSMVVRGCAQVCAGVCVWVGVHGCGQVFTGMYGCSRVCGRGVHRCAWVWEGVGRRGVRGCAWVYACVWDEFSVNFQNFFWRIESLH